MSTPSSRTSRATGCYPSSRTAAPAGRSIRRATACRTCPNGQVSLTGRYRNAGQRKPRSGFLQGALYARTGSNFRLDRGSSTKLPGYSLFDASIGLKQIDDKFKLTLFCATASTKRQPTFINTQLAVARRLLPHVGLNSFRTLGVSLDGRF